jgi:ribonuclease Y
MNYIQIIAWIIFWISISIAYFFVLQNKKITKSWDKSKEIINQAHDEKNKILQEAKRESNEILKKTEKIEERILDREEKIENKLEQIELKHDKIVLKEENIIEEKEKLKIQKDELAWKLSEMSKLSEKEAKTLFLKDIETKYSSDWVDIIKKYKNKLEEEKKDIAKNIILKSIQQYAWDVTNEVTTTLIQIPSDDIKWKLIWKEWRNITSFEQNAWVALIIDDTPDTVFISAFDLFKRYVAKKALEKLIEDGRIQPARIEEVIKQTENDAETLLKELWRNTVNELWITNLPDEIIPIIWKLRFRTSYWQNILKHSKETAIIAERIASELWVDSKIVKIWWLLHDIWKALDQEYEWTHPEIWWILARKYKINEKIIDMIENHHWEQFSISIEAAIVQVADAISSVRPWARREVIEEYLKRVWEMEALVQSFSWVNKAYALSAGREIRLFVDAKTVSDLDAANMAKEIAETIQTKLSYPWEVKVNLIREMRVIEVAK